MRLASSCIAVAIVAAGVLLYPAAEARAQSPEAEVLFREGRRLIKLGKLAAGCDKLEASERIETSAGTLLNLGDCREKLGRFASAWAAFRKAEAVATRPPRDDKRRAEAVKRATSLEAKLTHLVVEVKQPVDGLVVRRDAELVDPAMWGSAVPVDPDTYTIVAEAPGYKPWTIDIPIDPKLKRRVVTIPKLERAPVARVADPPVVRAPAPAPVPEPAPVIVAPAPTGSPRPVIVTRRAGTWSTTRKLSVVVALAGAGAIGGGVYFGDRANELEDRANARCPLAVCSDREGLRLNADAQDAAWRANIYFAGGGAAVVLATVMWLAGAPDDETIVTPTIGDRQAGVSVMRRF